ncbi:MAG: helix-turn-helix domain-containing protein, partial [Candidatus Thermoplasmatota archaeon]
MVCEACSKFGMVKAIKRTVAIAKPKEKKKEEDVFSKIEAGKKIVEDYAKKIKERRNKLSLSLEDLSKKVNEKKSIISKLEAGVMVPDEKLAKKLEKALGIELIEKDK